MGRTVKSQSQKQVLLFGAGYTAKALIPSLLNRGYAVTGTTRDSSGLNALSKLGVRPIVFNSETIEAARTALERAEIILSSIPPENGRDPVIASFPGDFVSHAPNLAWAGYLSATSVYGDRDGKWAFENELLKPETQRGRDRAEAELNWLESGAPVHIFRLAGIYGPGRSPFAKIRNGKARGIIKPGHVVNRIHVDDIVTAILKSLDNPAPVRAYNLADDSPAPPQDVLDFAAQLIGVDTPPHIPLDEANISDMARSFYRETKRVSNARAKAVFGWTPQYPNYKSGLRATLRAERALL